ncbi:aminodeoxychorismate synthase component I [Ornithinibacillus xuwenensis]|uniref:Aminodeoxychorismate synthase component I n=1 Tax=Ornithinibacillus xuwenensis TaxID=3144668 RepID=A0ABU9XJ22_9BACI
MRTNNTMLHFDFNGKPTTFRNPIKIITAFELEQVIPAFEKVQEAIQQGFYAAGFVSYEAAPAFDSAMEVHANNQLPLLWFGIYDSPSTDGLLPNHESYHATAWQPDTTIADYNNAINQIKAYIEQGDTYQVNYTIRMKSQFNGEAIGLYHQLASSQSANYSAYLDIGGHRLLSASPELFFHLKDGKVTTKPMKGTVARGRTATEDKENAEWLYHSEKNRAENVMIVDLLRNDLGVIAKPGTVKVPELFSIEKYPTVYQMTSTVTADIDESKSITEVFQALFPCGSITGAPKISTMRIIKELETSPRDVYCGAIGFITPEMEAIFNVPIRTVILDDAGNATYGVGGGITWDSTDKDEYAEVLTKAKILSNKQQDFKLLETIGLVNGEYLVLDNHLNRIQNSASYFNFALDHQALKEELLEIANQYKAGKWKVRVLLSRIGTTTIEAVPEVFEEKELHVSLAKHPIQESNIFLYHKTTNRIFYEEVLKQSPHVFDVLLWNEQEEITEFTKGNVVVELDGKFVTPPVSCGLLPGTYREALLQDGKVSERVIRVEELGSCSSIWFINSVKEWVKVKLI